MKSCGNNYHFEDRKRKTFVKQDWKFEREIDFDNIDIFGKIDKIAKSDKSDKIGKMTKKSNI